MAGKQIIEKSRIKYSIFFPHFNIDRAAKERANTNELYIKSILLKYVCLYFGMVQRSFRQLYTKILCDID